MTELPGRTDEEQALADRIGRLFTDPIPLAVLRKLVEAEQKHPGWVTEMLARSDAPISLTDFAASFWGAFAIKFWEAHRAKAAAGKEPPQ